MGPRRKWDRGGREYLDQEKLWVPGRVIGGARFLPRIRLAAITGPGCTGRDFDDQGRVMPDFLTSSLKGKMALGFGALHLLVYLVSLLVLASGDDAAIGLALILLIFGGGGMLVVSAASLQGALLDSHRAESALAAGRPSAAQALARRWRWPLMLGGAVLLIGGLVLTRFAFGPAVLLIVCGGVSCLFYGVTVLTPLPDARPTAGPWGAARGGAATAAGRDRIRLGLRTGLIGARGLGPREARAVTRLATRFGLRHLVRKLLRRLPEPVRRVLFPLHRVLIAVLLAFAAVQVLAMLLTRLTPLPRGGLLAPAVSAALLGTMAVAIWLRRRRDGGG